MKYIITTLMFFVLLLYAGEEGRIVGKIIDAETNKSLEGVNVTVIDSPLGISSNSVGEYEILHVPPGTYSLKASRIGYESIIVNGVNVSADKTTSRDFQLKETAIRLPPTVVTANRPTFGLDSWISIRSMYIIENKSRYKLFYPFPEPYK